MAKKGKQEERYTAHIKTASFYKFYSDRWFREYEGKKIIINRDTDYYIDLSTYATVIDSFNRQLRDLILMENYEFTMPHRMGRLSIKKKKLTPYIDKNGDFKNPLPIDWKKTNELWDSDPVAKEKKTLVRHYNEHTNGYVAKWFYSTNTATFKWKSAYAFIPCRTAKQLLAGVLKDEDSGVDYYLR